MHFIVYVLLFVLLLVSLGINISYINMALQELTNSGDMAPRNTLWTVFALDIIVLILVIIAAFIYLIQGRNIEAKGAIAVPIVLGLAVILAIINWLISFTLQVYVINNPTTVTKKGFDYIMEGTSVFPVVWTTFLLVLYYLEKHVRGEINEITVPAEEVTVY